MLQRVWGLYSNNIQEKVQEKVLATGAVLKEGQEMNLSDVVKQVEAAERSK